MNMHFTNNKYLLPTSPCSVLTFLNTLYVFLSALNHGVIFLRAFCTAITPGVCSANTDNPVEVMTTAAAVKECAHAGNDNRPP